MPINLYGQKRNKREQVRLPEYVAYSFASDNYNLAHMDEHIPLEHMDRILDRVDINRRKLFRIE